MAFKDNNLEISDTKIIEVGTGIEVMMGWEAPIMERTAEYICQSKGDILEIGFGMGICSDYIQSQGVNSHTIVEIHPQIIEKLKVWADGKGNVTIVEGDWYTLRNHLDIYDGIFLDTFGDEQLDNFKSFAIAKARSGCKVSYWNNQEEEFNPYSFDSVTYEKVSVTPEENLYTNILSNYYMPKVVL